MRLAAATIPGVTCECHIRVEARSQNRRATVTEALASSARMSQKRDNLGIGKLFTDLLISCGICQTRDYSHSRLMPAETSVSSQP